MAVSPHGGQPAWRSIINQLTTCEIFVQYLTMATYGTDTLTYWSIIDSCVKNRQYLRTYGIPLNSASNSLSYDIVRFKIEVGVDVKFICKNVTLNTRELPAVAGRQRQHSRRHFVDAPRTASNVNMLGLCDPSNLLFILSAEERRALLKLLWELVYMNIIMWSICNCNPSGLNPDYTQFICTYIM